jgi:hypothetical protein
MAAKHVHDQRGNVNIVMIYHQYHCVFPEVGYAYKQNH